MQRVHTNQTRVKQAVYHVQAAHIKIPKVNLPVNNVQLTAQVVQVVLLHQEVVQAAKAATTEAEALA